MKYCVIGKGFIFPRHKKAIEETGGKIVLTCDTRFNETQPDFTDWVEMYNHPRFKEVDTVVVCTPNYLHSVMTREALLRGKKVLCEKPLSINGTEGLEGVVPVLQLRYAPQLQNLKANLVEVVAKMYRNDTYWSSWKGDEIKSGGILYNLGIHYIDLLIFLLGNPIEILTSEVSNRLTVGTIKFEKGIGTYWIEVLDNRNQQDRYINIDGQRINLSDKDNLSYEDLHIEVYKHFIKGEGIPLGEAAKSLHLVEDLLKFK